MTESAESIIIRRAKRALRAISSRDLANQDKNVLEVRERLLDRALCGMNKYGVTTERDDLTTLQWLQHLQDELLDGAVYIERLKGEINDGTGSK